VEARDTRDGECGDACTGAEDRRERFHPMDPGAHLAYARKDPAALHDWTSADKWKETWAGDNWFDDYTMPFGLQEGLACCSVDSISFHWLGALDMKAIHRSLTHCREPS